MGDRDNVMYSTKLRRFSLGYTERRHFPDSLAVQLGHVTSFGQQNMDESNEHCF